METARNHTAYIRNLKQGLSVLEKHNIKGEMDVKNTTPEDYFLIGEVGKTYLEVVPESWFDNPIGMATKHGIPVVVFLSSPVVWKDQTEEFQKRLEAAVLNWIRKNDNIDEVIRKKDYRKNPEALARELEDTVNFLNFERDSSVLLTLVETITRAHRTLQQSMAFLFWRCFEKWAEKWKEDDYDLRNEDTCKLAHLLTKHVEEDLKEKDHSDPDVWYGFRSI